MGRKSLKDTRATEILDAFEVCIARQGFNNVHLADIGKQAEIQRPAIRHFVGNRDEVCRALAQRYVARAKEQVSALEEISIPLNLKSKSAISSLLIESVMTDEHKFITLSNLFLLAKTEQEINQIMQEWVDTYVNYLVNVLMQNYQGGKLKITDIAYNIISACIGLSALSCLDAAQYSKLISGAIAQQVSGLNAK